MPQHLRSLTSLRFFAAAAVAVGHLPVFVEALRFMSAPVGLSYTAVEFFFMLSGFVLTWTLRPADSARRFYLRRFARIYPVFLLTTLVALFVPRTTNSPEDLVWHLTLTQAWPAWSPVSDSFNSVSWSLSCEAFFYLLFPLVVVPLRRLRASYVIALGVGYLLVAGAVVTIFTNSSGLYRLPMYRLGEFVVGIGLALLIEQGWRSRLTIAQAVWIAALAYGLTRVLETITHRLISQTWIIDLLMLPGFAAIIFAAASRDITSSRGVLQSSPMVKLGQWSFALYMVHLLVLFTLIGMFPNPSTGQALFIAGATLVLSVLISGGVYEWYERPLEKWIRGWSRQRESLVSEG